MAWYDDPCDMVADKELFMIYTVTFNPSIDYMIRVKDFKAGQINRTDFESFLPGGKGINVSVVLKNLGFESTALGFIAGFTGKEIESCLDSMGISSQFIEVEHGYSRINVKLKSDEETEINGQGPLISKLDMDELFRRLDVLKNGDTLVISGDIPNTLPNNMYERILKDLCGKDIQVVVDAEKEVVKKVLPYHPFLIKLNIHELSKLFHYPIKKKTDVVFYAKKMKRRGARNILISMAGDGAVFVGEDGEILECEAPKGEIVNVAGAGDSMVAGFLAGYLDTHSMKMAFGMGVCAGSASVFSSGLATKEQVKALMEGK